MLLTLASGSGIACTWLPTSASMPRDTYVVIRSSQKQTKYPRKVHMLALSDNERCCIKTEQCGMLAVSQDDLGTYSCSSSQLHRALSKKYSDHSSLLCEIADNMQFGGQPVVDLLQVSIELRAVYSVCKAYISNGHNSVPWFCICCRHCAS